MKRHVQYPGVRKWSGNDLLELQSEGLSISDRFFSQYGNCVICGCSVLDGTISAGLVTIGGIVMPFDAIAGIEVFPVYLVRDENHAQREYADGVVRDIAVGYHAKIAQEKPASGYIEITEYGAPVFFDKIKSTWLTDIEKQLADLVQVDDDVWKSIELLHDFDAEIASQVDEIEERMPSLMRLPPTLPTKPTQDTLTYLSGEVICDFSIGQQCRVYDTENKKYVFYQLCDIMTDNKADWRIGGSGESLFSETVKINLYSNQGMGDTTLKSVNITIKYTGFQTDLIWDGAELSVVIPMGVQYQVICGSVTGYSTPGVQSWLAVGGNKRQINLVYSTEKVTVNILTDDEADCSSRTIQVIDTANSHVVGTGKGESVIIKVPFGITYKIEVDDCLGYSTPKALTFTSNSIIRTVTFLYEKVEYSSIVFDKSISDPSNISGEINSGFISLILSKFRRCLCKKTGEGEVAISYLNNDDSNYYEDGTPAKLDGTEGDVMVYFPEFYYKHEKIDENKYRYCFALYNIDGMFNHVSCSLVGAYKAVYMNGSKICSQSGKIVDAGKNYLRYVEYATNRGAGYQIIDFQQHCVIAFMLYAKYGNRNLQSVLGTGLKAKYYTTGTTNLKGNRDTVNEASGFVNGLGIEGVFGGLNECMQGISVYNGIYTISDPDGTQRNIGLSATGWIKNIKAEDGPFFDMIPTKCNGSETTYYSDYCYGIGGEYTCCVMRSSYDDDARGGVSAIDAYLNNGQSSEFLSSRLAFRGIIHEYPNVVEFKALGIL